jgi:hypothetical protein
MKARPGIKALLTFALLFAVPACTLMDLVQPYQGDLRLIAMKVPELTVEDVSYDVEVTFETQGQLNITKACFRWLTERASVSSPPLHCYASEVQNNAAMGSECSRWTTEGVYGQASPEFCTNIEKVDYDIPGHFLVKLQTRNVQRYYHNLECYAQYNAGGVTKHSNKIRSRILVQD